MIHKECCILTRTQSRNWSTVSGSSVVDIGQIKVLSRSRNLANIRCSTSSVARQTRCSQSVTASSARRRNSPAVLDSQPTVSTPGCSAWPRQSLIGHISGFSSRDIFSDTLSIRRTRICNTTIKLLQFELHSTQRIGL